VYLHAHLTVSESKSFQLQHWNECEMMLEILHGAAGHIGHKLLTQGGISS